MHRVLDRAEADANALAKAGFDGVIVENFGDVPFFPDVVPPETIAALTLLSKDKRKDLRVKALLALSRLGDKRIVGELWELLQKGNPDDRYEVEVHGTDYIVLRERDIHAVAAERLDEGSTGLYL